RLPSFFNEEMPPVAVVGLRPYYLFTPAQSRLSYKRSFMKKTTLTVYMLVFGLGALAQDMSTTNSPPPAPSGEMQTAAVTNAAPNPPPADAAPVPIAQASTVTTTTTTYSTPPPPQPVYA